jgi:trehalose 6-phosphate phosphatase
MAADLQVFRQAAGHAGIFIDFDGTLSDIVPVASSARPVAGARDLLGDLAERYAVVAVVSGRSAEELVRWLGPEIEIWGVYGAQRAIAGKVELSAATRPFARLMAEVKQEAESSISQTGLEGVGVEDKAVVITLHWRAARDVEAAERAVEDVTKRIAERHGLSLSGTRFTRELRPPIDLSKSVVVLERARELGLSAVMFVGDDVVDLAAFDALDELAEDAMTTVRVAVSSDEAPEELLRRADVIVDGPRGVIELLRRLL